jgi:hypothetical protein
MALPFNIFYLLVQYLYFLILNIKIVKFDSNNHNHIQWLPFFHSFVSQCVLIYLEFMIKLRLSHPFYLCKSTTDLWDLLLNAIIYPYIYKKVEHNLSWITLSNTEFFQFLISTSSFISNFNCYYIRLQTIHWSTMSNCQYIYYLI